MTVVAGLLFFLGNLFHADMAWRSLVLLALLPLAVTYLILFIYGVLLIRSYAAAFSSLRLRERIATALVYPVFLLEMAAFYPVGLFRARKEQGPDWIETEREADR